MRSALWPHLQHPAVHRPGDPGYIAGLWRCEECDHVGDLPGVAGPAHGDAGSVLLRGVGVGLSGHRGGDLAGSYGVAGDAVLGEFKGSSLDQATEAVLLPLQHWPVLPGACLYMS